MVESIKEEDEPVRVDRGTLVQEFFGGFHRVNNDDVHAECI